MSAEPLAAQAVAELVRDAVAAPSMHNAQPWRFRFFAGSSAFHVRSDQTRAMPHADPDGRALRLGCGAALLNLRVAAAHAGWEPVTELLPDPADPELLATVRLAGPVRADDDLVSLHPAIDRRHTSRYPFTEEEIPEAIRADLRGAAVAEGARLVFPEAWHVETLLGLVQDAEGRDAPYAEQPGVYEDMVRWTHTGAGDAESAPEGVPAYAFGPSKRDGKAPVRDFAGRRAVAGRGTATFEKTPQLALLGTAEDGPVDWLRAGQAMERVLLQATLDGLATALTSHALEWPDLRWAVRDPVTAMGHVQMVLRLGYGPPGHATPRRPVADVLDIEP